MKNISIYIEIKFFCFIIYFFYFKNLVIKLNRFIIKGSDKNKIIIFVVNFIFLVIVFLLLFLYIFVVYFEISVILVIFISVFI